MSERIEPSALDVQIDRLVDGELGKREYRALLTLLDGEPDGWRRCAMAFLEAQALHIELPEICRATRTLSPTAVRASRQSNAIVRSLSWVLAAAASLLLAFSLGWSVRSSRHNATPSVPVMAAAQPDVIAPQSQDVAAAEVPGQASDAGSNLASAPFEEPSAAGAFDDTGVVPPDVQWALERLGYAILRDRQWAPLESGGGRVFVPLEKVEIRPVSADAY